MTLTAAQRDRSCGTLLGSAAGDALGAGYEFGLPLEVDVPVDMIGGGLGPFKPGEWTDDTSMAIAIAEFAATGADLRDENAQDYIVERWEFWARTAKDVGNQTRSVLSTAGRRGISARTAREESAALHQRTGHTAGNGSLMRTAPVALAYLDDEVALAEAARAVSELTHYDPDAGDACVLWCAAIRHAVLTGELDARVGMGHIPVERRQLWASRLDDAEASQPSAFSAKNGWVVAALQAAWSAIVNTPVPVEDAESEVFPADHLRLALEAAVRGGHDTDTVAAIAGALLGAAYGASAVPSRWRSMLQGWPGLTARGLVHLADKIIDKGRADTFDYTYSGFPAARKPVQHPYDEKVWIGGVAALQNLPQGVDAIVSLCRVKDEHLPAGIQQLDVRLIDCEGENDHVEFVLLDTVRAIERLRAEGRTVFVHCVQAYSRTPTIAALYGARKQGVGTDQALDDVVAVLPGANPNAEFRATLRRLDPRRGGVS
ncbi:MULTISPECIES: ADP-ribosylglycohydrolase family protein [unclassified Mycobacterium]|uniref:ADP-ribosylglycohydrolase family protein n=1 Tax=unclassified Mycobacterium TaxID=2642494 RepID=UPI0007FEBE12|nr:MULTISPECIES: ADP-ribosylglycohydrolase family protein [unclassified Mycobacterium]OBG78127.1 ribosylglycohydrolase [Mycobacterium sp. E1214]OBH29998.1 ribosylglycohydrolase [Mycobacterium sp. E1319]